MEFKEYQIKSRQTAIYPDKDNNFIYPSLGLCGEAGEVAEKIKKVLRDKGGIIDETTRQELNKELGDVLWYISQLATELNLSLEEVAQITLPFRQKQTVRRWRQSLTDNYYFFLIIIF
jgi:NTP pyrophosphatase (non-canonical NTP hydrolase)